MFIVKHRKVFFAITGTIVALALGALIFFGLHQGTDFTGGTLVQVKYEKGRPDAKVLSLTLDEAGFKGYSLRGAGENDYILRTGSLTNEMRSSLPATFSVHGGFPASISELTEVGPTVGLELRNKAIIALGLVMLAILTVLGFSIHDTIVVFDRVRENLRVNQERGRREDFAETAGRSLGQTFVRSINTSLTVLITLLALFFLGPASTKDFALTLLVGIIAGTYSSIFLATPLLVSTERYFANRR